MKPGRQSSDADNAPPRAETPTEGGHPSKPRARVRWGIAVAVALAVHAGAFLAWRVPEPRKTHGALPSPRVSLATANPESLLGDQLNLRDSAPLFLPTKWNYATAVKAVRIDRSPGEIFDRYPVKLTVAADQSPVDLPVLPAGVADDAVSAIRKFEWPYFEAFGQIDRPLVRLPERLALMEVRSVANGRTVLTREIPVQAAPSAQGWGFWMPLEFLVAVESSGMLGPPELSRGSSFEEVDAFFRGYVQREAQLSLRVPAGYYRVTIGP